LQLGEFPARCVFSSPAVVITLFGEIAPQPYFSRNALRMTARFLPFLIFWRAALFFSGSADCDVA
jgi:CBS domain containing-hemolysin-like protein